MRKKGRSRIAVLLGIGAICGMLGTTGRYVYAENMTTATAAIEESTGDITPATGYEVSENAGPELYTSDEWISALLGMCTKFSEVTLAVHFREKNDKGEFVGGLTC